MSKNIFQHGLIQILFLNNMQCRYLCFISEHIGHVVRMSVSGYRGLNPGISMLCP